MHCEVSCVFGSHESEPGIVLGAYSGMSNYKSVLSIINTSIQDIVSTGDYIFLTRAKNSIPTGPCVAQPSTEGRPV
jgi:hypothetical protein